MPRCARAFPLYRGLCRGPSPGGKPGSSRQTTPLVSCFTSPSADWPYIRSMNYDRFELSVIELASRGVRLTVANVTASLRVEPNRAEEWLDRMAQEGRLDVEIDEEVGLIFYRVRGLSPTTTALAHGWPTGEQVLDQPKGSKSAAAGALLGLMLPGVGLIYAAPWTVAALGTVATLVAVKMFAALPLIGWLLSSIALGVCALASGLAGMLYTHEYNRRGGRKHLHKQQVAAHAATWPHSAAAAVQSALR
jgi:hypothetical protein